MLRSALGSSCSMTVRSRSVGRFRIVLFWRLMVVTSE